jgi:hypothetical protein
VMDLIDVQEVTDKLDALIAHQKFAKMPP